MAIASKETPTWLKYWGFSEPQSDVTEYYD